MSMDLQEQVRQEQTRLEAVVADALAIARQLGADSAEVSISKQTGLSVNTRGGEVESIEFNKDGALGMVAKVPLPRPIWGHWRCAVPWNRHWKSPGTRLPTPTRDSRMPNGWPGMFPIWTCYTPLSRIRTMAWNWRGAVNCMRWGWIHESSSPMVPDSAVIMASRCMAIVMVSSKAMLAPVIP